MVSQGVGTDEDGGEAESLAEVLASIRTLVSAETEARMAVAEQGETVLMLTEDMRADRRKDRGLLAAGIEGGRADAPILDEESLRELINSIVREELQGELGDRINRNLRKLIRREIAAILEEQRKP